VLGAAAEFERSLIRERTQAGQARYRQDFESGKVGKTVASRSGRNLPPYRPRKIFDREEVLRLRRQGRSYRQIASPWDWGWRRSSGRCRRVPKVRSRQLEHRTACWLWRGRRMPGLRPLVRLGLLVKLGRQTLRRLWGVISQNQTSCRPRAQQLFRRFPST
jgi:hypothetical protein